MPANLDDVGIQSSGLALLESIEYSKKIEEAIITDSDSSFGHAAAFNPTIDFSLKGRGDIPAGLAVGTDGGAGGAANLTGINDGDGTILILSTKEGETNTDFNSWEASGTYWPNASPSA